MPAGNMALYNCFEQFTPTGCGHPEGVATVLETSGKCRLCILFGKYDFTRGEEDQLGQSMQGALRNWIEGPDSIDEVTEKFDPDRQRQIWWKDVEDSPTDGKSAGILHERCRNIAKPHQFRQQFFPCRFFTRQQVLGNVTQRLFRQDFLDHGSNGGNNRLYVA